MNPNEMIEIIVIVLIMAGIVFSLLSSLGFLRLPDVYTRIHAGAKGITVGTLLILFGAFLYFWVVHDTISIRLILVIVFVFLTAPVSGQLVIRAAYRSGVKLADVSVKDDLARDLAEQEKVEASSNHRGPEQCDDFEHREELEGLENRREDERQEHGSDEGLSGEPESTRNSE